MPSLRAFLQAILPTSGVKCLAIFRNGKPQHQWSEDFDTMEMAALSADAQGATVYHGCASYISRGDTWSGRKSSNAGAVRSFWLDVDAGESDEGKPAKPYRDTPSAYRATEAFRKTIGLPPPIYVRSGLHGLHVYWPLDTDVPPDTWLEHANGLKHLCRIHGFAADPARTADLASILRPPGTHNRKSGEPVEVVCGPLVGPYPLGAFEVLRVAPGVGPAPVLRRAKNGSAGPIAAALSGSLAEAFHRPSHAAIIATRCPQIERLSRASETGTRYDNNVWHAGIGVLAYAVKGDESARLWARGYDGYDEASTSAWVQGELDRRRHDKIGPTTCGHFHSLAPDVCAACPHFGHLTSPIQLGYEDDKPRLDANSSSSDIATVRNNNSLPSLPTGYIWRDGALYHTAEKSNGHDAAVLISRYPIYLESVGNAEIDADAHSYNFRVVLPLGDRTISIGAGKLVGSEGIGYLQGRGAVIHDGPLFKKYVNAAVDMFNADKNPVVRYEQFGWKDNEQAFLWGRSIYKANTIIPASGMEEISVRGRDLGPAKGGSLPRWTAIANRLFATGCEPYAFALLCAFAAPLMRFHSTNEGGAILVLVGPPGIGKSTALDAAGSVWGTHDALNLNAFDTRASKGVNLGVLGNLPVIYDEMEKQDADVLRDFVSVFTNGRDRNRATVDGGLRHEARAWQTIIIGAANRSVAELVERNNDSDGLSSRILELPGELPEGMSAAEADMLRDEMKRNHGWAADTYLKLLLQPEILAWVKESLRHNTDVVWQRTGFDREKSKRHRFWVRMIASVWVAGILVEKLKLVEFNPQRIVDWIIEHVSGRVEIVEGKVLTNASTVLGDFINAHQDCILDVPRPWERGQVQRHIDKPPRNLVIRHERTPDRYLIAEKPLRDWLDRKKISMKALLDDLDGTVVVNKRRLATLSAGTDIPGGQVVVVEINGAHPALTGILVDANDAVLRRPASA